MTPPASRYFGREAAKRDRFSLDNWESGDTTDDGLVELVLKLTKAEELRMLDMTGTDWVNETNSDERVKGMSDELDTAWDVETAGACEGRVVIFYVEAMNVVRQKIQ
jgi:hypothetical protein